MTRSITVKNHDERCHVTDITVMQQQPEDSETIGKLTILKG